MWATTGDARDVTTSESPTWPPANRRAPIGGVSCRKSVVSSPNDSVEPPMCEVAASPRFKLQLEGSAVRSKFVWAQFKAGAVQYAASDGTILVARSVLAFAKVQVEPSPVQVFSRLRISKPVIDGQTLGCAQRCVARSPVATCLNLGSWAARGPSSLVELREPRGGQFVRDDTVAERRAIGS